MKIKWKFLSRMNCYEGYVNEQHVFSIEGTLCVTDLRPTQETVWKSPNYYKITSIQEGKNIADDLLNNLNVEIHQKNKDAWIAEQRKTVNLMDDVDKLLKSLRNK